MPKPRILEKYDVDESRCILCGICVDACPYDALRGGQDNELAHTGRGDPEVDLIAIADVERETEVTYIRRERDWLAHALAEGRIEDPAGTLPALPESLAGTPGKGRGAGKQ
jgi:formate hydrogenlyase subunit 6/NADH:ubiquinone oxidoreductase subunit I